MSETEKKVFKFRSEPLNCPIEQLSLIRQSLLLAELAQLAYYEESSAASTVGEIGLKETLFLDRDGAQAYVFRNDTDVIVACRGTEPTEINDLKADVDATSVLAETAGRVHRGFKKEVDDLWPWIEQELTRNDKALWFTGHSLGGAMASICAGRCQLSHINSNPKALFTFGSPRVGNKRYVNHVEIKHYRWVNNNDIVTRVPPAWLGFRHTGKLMYIDCNSEYRPMSRAHRARDRWRGFWMSLKQGKIDHLADHSMSGYVAAIASALGQDSAGVHKE